MVVLASLLACPLCAENMPTRAQDAGFNNGIFLGILFFLGMIYVMASGVIVFIRRSDPQRKRNRRTP